MRITLLKILNIRVNTLPMYNLDSGSRVNKVQFNKPEKYLATWLMFDSRDIRLKYS